MSWPLHASELPQEDAEGARVHAWGIFTRLGGQFPGGTEQFSCLPRDQELVTAGTHLGIAGSSLLSSKIPDSSSDLGNVELGESQCPFLWNDVSMKQETYW